MHAQIQSKVLVHESDVAAQEKLRHFFEENQLLALRASADNFMQVLSENTDLGGVFISNDTHLRNYTGEELAQFIHDKRPEVPVFFRTDATRLCDSGPINDRWFPYAIDDLDHLGSLIKERIFTNFYPIQFIQGIKDTSVEALSSIFKNVRIDVGSPLLVNDHIIYGELFSLIPLESHWCRGTMTLETTQDEMLDIIRSAKTNLQSAHPDLYELNDVLNELTNLIWGGIKSDFFLSGQMVTDISKLSQVPILVNHKQKYISFGTREPHLCFKYTLTTESQGSTKSFVIFQKLIFNLCWQPEDFKPVDKSADDMIESGELELF